MEFTINVFQEMGIKIVYIKEINNYFRATEHNLVLGNHKVSKEKLLNVIMKNISTKYEIYKNIIEKREALCKNSGNIKAATESKRFTLCLHPSRSCNLACRYCFAQNDYLPENRMSIDLAKKAIDFFIYDFAKNSNQYVIDLSGSGEPLLQFDFIQEVEEYVNLKRNELGKDIMIMFCTNGTLIDKEKAQYLKSKSRILLGVSIDGIEEDNKNRVYANQKESYTDVMQGIKMLSPKKVGLAVTFTQYNEKVDKIFCDLANIENCDCVSIQNVRDFSNSDFSFERVNLKHVFDSYQRLTNKLIESILEDNFDYFEKIIKGADTFGMYIRKVLYKGKLNIYRCEAGKTRIAVDDKGLIYTCSVMNGCQEFCIGSIFEGIKQEKVEDFLKSYMVSEQCVNCWAANLCSGECNANAYYAHGELYHPYKKMCKYRKKLIKLAITFWLLLEELDSEKYNQAKKMVNRVSNFYVQDIGAWAVMTLLKKMKIGRHYEEVLCSLQQDAHGISPIEVKKYLNKTTEYEFGIFKINNSSLNEINLPAIGFLNNSGMPYYEYCLILGIEEKIVDVMVMDNTLKIKLYYEEFLRKCNLIIMRK